MIRVVGYSEVIPARIANTIRINPSKSPPGTIVSIPRTISRVNLPMRTDSQVGFIQLTV